MPITNKGEGSIFYNKQRKKYNAQYYEYDPQTNRNKIKTKSFKTEEEAKKFLEMLMYQRENPVFIEHNGIPLIEIMRQNLELKYKTNQISDTQYRRVKMTLDKMGESELLNEKADNISSYQIQEYLNDIRYLSNSSISKVYQQFSKAFEIAMNKGYINRNPMVNVIKPKSDKLDKKVRALTLEEEQAFTELLINKDIKACRYKNLFLIQMYLGLRVSEGLALTMNDIDLRNRTISISKTLTTDEKGAVKMGRVPKTDSGNRTLKIPDFLYPYIVEQMKFADKQENNEEKLLFKPKDQKYTRRTTVNSVLRKMLKSEFGIEGISTHSLRHTFCTRCSEAGMSPFVTAKLMGHANTDMVNNVYTDVYDNFKEKEIEKVNNYYLNSNNALLESNMKMLQEKDGFER